MPTQHRRSSQPAAIVPIGTQIVTAEDIRTSSGNLLQYSGAVGCIVEHPQTPTGEYRIRFTDSTISPLKRRQFKVLKEFKNQLGDPESLPQTDFANFIIYRCIVGSRAYGLDHDDSDIDRRGIFLPPARDQWSLFGVPEQIEKHESQECYWELEKFLRLALKANPNVLECLYTPLVEYKAPLAEELLQMRSTFLTRTVYQTYNGYVLSQFKKLGQDLRNKGAIRWKHAMHLIRLLLSGIIILRDQVVPVEVGDYREKLLEIRRGEWTWREIDKWRKQLHKEFDHVWHSSKLPEHPDYTRVNDFLIRARRSMVEGKS